MKLSRHVAARFTQFLREGIEAKFMLVVLIEPEHRLAGNAAAVAGRTVAIGRQHGEQADEQAGDAFAVHRLGVAAKQIVDMAMAGGNVRYPRRAAASGELL